MVGPGAHAFIRIYGWNALTPGLGLDWSIQTKRVGFGEFHGGSYLVSGEVSRRHGRLLITRATRKSYWEFTFACDSVGCCLVCALA